MLKLTDEGNLVILDGSKGMIWFSNLSRIAVKPVMQLLDSGNLVVKDADSTESENLLWESFDHPGNTLLPGMKLKSNLITGPYQYLTSWRSPEDPAEGEFSYWMDTHGFPQLVVAKGATIVERPGSWNGYLFTGSPWQRMSRVLNYSFVFTEKEVSFEYKNLNSSLVTRYMLDPYGHRQLFIWSERTKKWEFIATRPVDQCEDYALYGVNSNCNIDKFPICRCLQGFTPKFQAKWDNQIGLVGVSGEQNQIVSMEMAFLSTQA